MRPTLILLLVLAFGAFASSAYILIKSNTEKIACQKNCTGKKKPVIDQNGGIDELYNPSFKHMIASAIK